MTTKEVLQKILTKLQSYWPMAEQILALLGRGELTDVQINGVLDIINETLKTVADEGLRKKLESVRDFLQRLHEQETADRKKEEIELEALLKSLDTL